MSVDGAPVGPDHPEEMPPPALINHPSKLEACSEGQIREIFFRYGYREKDLSSFTTVSGGPTATDVIILSRDRKIIKVYIAGNRFFQIYVWVANADAPQPAEIEELRTTAMPYSKNQGAQFQEWWKQARTLPAPNAPAKTQQGFRGLVQQLLGRFWKDVEM